MSSSPSNKFLDASRCPSTQENGRPPPDKQRGEAAAKRVRYATAPWLHHTSNIFTSQAKSPLCIEASKTTPSLPSLPLEVLCVCETDRVRVWHCHDRSVFSDTSIEEAICLPSALFPKKFWACETPRGCPHINKCLAAVSRVVVPFQV